MNQSNQPSVVPGASEAARKAHEVMTAHMTQLKRRSRGASIACALCGVGVPFLFNAVERLQVLGALSLALFTVLAGTLVYGYWMRLRQDEIGRFTLRRMREDMVIGSVLASLSLFTVTIFMPVAERLTLAQSAVVFINMSMILVYLMLMTYVLYEEIKAARINRRLGQLHDEVERIR